MKRIDIVVPDDLKQIVIDCLENKDNKYPGPSYPGITFFDVTGRGGTKYNAKREWFGNTFEVKIFPKIKLEIMVRDKDKDVIINRIRGTVDDFIKVENQKKEEADKEALRNRHYGRIFVYDVLETIRLRDGVRDEEALFQESEEDFRKNIDGRKKL